MCKGGRKVEANKTNDASAEDHEASHSVSRTMQFHAARPVKSPTCPKLTSCGASSACCLYTSGHRAGKMLSSRLPSLRPRRPLLTIDSVTDEEQSYDGMNERGSTGIVTFKVTLLVSRKRVRSGRLVRRGAFRELAAAGGRVGECRGVGCP